MIYYLLKRILGEQYTVGVIKSILLRELNCIKRFSWAFFKDRLAFVSFMLFFPFSFPFRLKPQKNNLTIFEIEKTKDIIHQRKLFAVHYLLESENINLADYNIGDEIFYRNDRLFNKICLILKVWCLFMNAFFHTLCMKRCYRIRENYRIFILLINAILCESVNNKIVCFRLYQNYGYLTPLLISNIAPENQIFSVGESCLFYEKRYTVMPKVKLLVCSVYHQEEINNYLKMNWVRVKQCVLTGPEDYFFYKNLKPVDAVYDIGIYSSGWWARKDGLFRSNDVKSISNLIFANNNFHMDFLKVLECICRLKKKYDLKVKLYLHPYESDILRKYNLLLPYASILDNSGIDWVVSNTNSIGKIYECKMGISLFSTVILERWMLGLDGLIYYNENYKDIFRPTMMGKYADFVFHSMEELELKIENQLRIDGNKR